MIAERDRLKLKAAARLALREVGSLEAAAVLLGKGHSQLARYTHADAPDFMPVDTVAALEAIDGVSPHVTRALALLAGCALVPLPAVSGAGAWVAHLAALAKETGDVMQALGERLAGDGAISADEAPAVRAQVAELQGVLARLDAALKAAETAPDPGAKEGLPPKLRSVTR